MNSLKSMGVIILILFSKAGFSQHTFPDRSLLISGGITSEQMVNADSTLINLSSGEANLTPATYKRGIGISLEVALISKRKEGKKGYNVFSFKADVANMSNDILIYRDTFVGIGNNIYRGEDIFVSRTSYKPYEIRRASLGYGRWYTKPILKGKLDFTFGVNASAGIEDRSYYSFQESGENGEVFIENFSILTALELNAVLSYPLNPNLSIFAKGLTNFLTIDITNSKSNSEYESTFFDSDMSLNIDYFQIGLLFTLKNKSDDNQ